MQVIKKHKKNMKDKKELGEHRIRIRYTHGAQQRKCKIFVLSPLMPVSTVRYIIHWQF